MANKDNSSKIDLIVLGLYFPGIDILKYFSRAGLNCIGLDCELNAPGLNLRNIKVYKCPNPEKNEHQWLDYLFEFRGRNGVKPIILNTSDRYIKTIINHHNAIERDFLFHSSLGDITSTLMNKGSLVKYAEERGVPTPKTYFFNPRDDYKSILSDFKFPCLIRPEFGRQWFNEPLKTIVRGEKLVKAKDIIEMHNWLEKILPYDNNLIFQEIIEGPDENLYYSVCYISRDNKILGYFTGQKLRIIPIHFGSASFMRTCSSEQVLPLCKKLLENSGYHGPAGIEFKKDERDGQLKLVEINTRFGLWDVMGLKTGVDLYQIAWNELKGHKIKASAPNERKTHYWLSLTRDLAVIRLYRNEGLITICAWLKSFLKLPYIADLYLNEPKMMYNLYVNKLLRRVKK